MDKINFFKSLQKYNEGKATKEEQEFLESYYNLFENEENILNSFSVEEKEEYKNKIRNLISDKISGDYSPQHKIKFIGGRFSRLAAAAILLFILFSSALYIIINNRQHPKLEMVAELPKKNRVVFLPDGSKVILNAVSKLNYPSSFDDMDRREVTLEGEAYFDIRHDANKPFIVHSGKVETIVLGTAFNIQAIDGQESITVTVTRGKVKVIDQEKKQVLGVITPNQQIIYYLKDVNSVLNSVDSEKYLNWMNADLFCDNLTIAEVIELLEERYKVKIAIDDQSIQSQRFTTTFSKKERLENILKTICLFNNLDYTYDSIKSSFILTNKKQISSPPNSVDDKN